MKRRSLARGGALIADEVNDIEPYSFLLIQNKKVNHMRETTMIHKLPAKVCGNTSYEKFQHHKSICYQ